MPKKKTQKSAKKKPRTKPRKKTSRAKGPKRILAKVERRVLVEKREFLTALPGYAGIGSLAGDATVDDIAEAEDESEPLPGEPTTND